MSLIGIAVVVVGLLLSIGLHELGHMLPAKKFGVPVPVFSLGFGPKLLEKRWGSTLYRLSAIPLGGYVRISGMFAPARPGTPTTNKRGELTLAEEARRSSAEEMPEGMEEHAFYRLSAPKKVAVMFGGPLMNLFLAIVLFSVALIGVGVPSASTTLGEVPGTVELTSGTASGPAAAAGLQAGDKILSVDGHQISVWADVPRALDKADGSPIRVEFERLGQRESRDVQPIQTPEGRWILGVAAGVEYTSASLLDVARVTWATIVGTAAIVIRFPLAVWDVALSLITGTPRDGSGIMSIVGVGRLAGEITSGSQLPIPGGQPDIRGIAATLLMMLGSLNIALFVFNLLPVPPLDGGHVMGAIYEGIRRQFARMRGLADPGPADTARLVPLTYAVGGLLLVMTVILILADIIMPVTLSGH